MRVLDRHGSDLLGRYRCWPRNVACLVIFVHVDLDLVDGGARAWDGFLAMFIWLDPMQRDIVASDFVADSQFVWWGSWCLTSVSFHVAIPKRFAASDYKRWRREGIRREGVLIPLL